MDELNSIKPDKKQMLKVLYQVKLCIYMKYDETLQKAKIQRSFRVLDTDKNGRLSVSELINGLRVIGLNPTEREAKQLIDEADKSGTGFLLYEDYEKIMIDQMKMRDKEEELFTQAFQKFDRDGNGIIDFKELRHILCRTGDKLTDEEVDEFFQEADLDHDGKINYKEFVKTFCSM